MRSWRSTLIAAVAIPGSIIATFAVMRFLDFTLNNVTMLALVLMVGVVIDDAIVVLENVFRFIEEKGMPPMQAAIEGTREIGLAVLATTLSLVIVFLAGVVPVERHRPHAVPVWHDGRGGHPDLDADQLLADADDVLAAAAAADSYGRRRAAFAPRLVSLIEVALRRRAGVRRCGIAGSCACVAIAVIASNVPLYNAGQPGLRAHQRRRVGVRDSHHGPRRRIAGGDGRHDSRPSKHELATMPGIEHVLTTVGSRSRRREQRPRSTCSCEDIETRTFSFGRLWHATLAGQPVRSLAKATTRSAT